MKFLGASGLNSYYLKGKTVVINPIRGVKPKYLATELPANESSVKQTLLQNYL